MRPNKPLPPVSYLREVVTYDETSPSCLRWLDRPRHHFNTNRGFLISKTVYTGQPAGKGGGVPNRHMIIKINQERFVVSRVVYAIIHGIDPGALEIDHIDGNTLNNRVDNLRLATRQENARNKAKPANNTSGRIGVTWCDRTSKWMAQICHNQVNLFLGRYDNKKDAIAAREKAEIEHHREYSGSCSRGTSVNCKQGIL